MFEELFRSSIVNTDAEWSERIKKRNPCCVNCNSPSGVQAAHIVGRAIKLLRCCLLNGLTLCHICHRKATDDNDYHEKIMRAGLKKVFGFDFYDWLQGMKYQDGI